ncbi:hypothetical protein [Pseudoalteromonas sp. OOF1S-7]|uniref:hypothetical protein n=1 Tax=Pseudoalteromonas sp. OOF1S-7 TaxID=2917757 RepID=UPI001EF3FECE|nr:hypothetical protein [Pseudoalteromonas sp. OOF1S-7]MCG7535058.1 hypothetical protein [Pseudoalteromonas sp. OOF1S-7]
MTFTIHQAPKGISALQNKPLVAPDTNKKGAPSAAAEDKNSTRVADTKEQSHGITLSDEDKKVLSGEKAKEQAEEQTGLPPHIQKMVERLEKLKEEILNLKEELQALQTQQDQDDATKAMIEMKNNQLVQLQGQYFELMESIQKALKEAGITDPGIIIRAIT